MAEPSWEGDDDVRPQQRVKPPSALQQRIRTASFGQYTNDPSRAGMIYSPASFDQKTGDYIGDRTPTNFNVQEGGQARVNAAYVAGGGAKREQDLLALQASKEAGREATRAAVRADMQAVVDKKQVTARGGTQQELDLQAFAKKGGTRGIYAQFLAGQMGTGPKAQETLMRALGQQMGAARGATGLGADSAETYSMVAQEIRNLNRTFAGMVPADKLIQTGMTSRKESFIPSYGYREDYGTYTAPKKEEQVSTSPFPEVPRYLQGKGWEEIDEWENWKRDVEEGERTGRIQKGTVIPGLWDPSGTDPKYGGTAPGFASTQGADLLAEHESRLAAGNTMPGVATNYGIAPEGGSYDIEGNLLDTGATQAAVDTAQRRRAQNELVADTARRDQNRVTDELGDYTPYSTVPGSAVSTTNTLGRPVQYPDFSRFSGGGAGDPGAGMSGGGAGMTDLGDTSDPNQGPNIYTQNRMPGGQTTQQGFRPPTNQGGGWNPFAPGTAYADSPGGSTPGQMPYWLNQMPDGSGIDNEGYIYKWDPELGEGQWRRTGAMAGGPAQQPPVQQPTGQQPPVQYGPQEAPPGQGRRDPNIVYNPQDVGQQFQQWGGQMGQALAGIDWGAIATGAVPRAGGPGYQGPNTEAPWGYDAFNRPYASAEEARLGEGAPSYGAGSASPGAGGAGGGQPGDMPEGIAGMSFGGNSSSVRDQIAQLNPNTDPEAGMKASVLQQIMLAYSAQESFEQRARQGNVTSKEIAEMDNTSREAIAAIDNSVALQDMNFTNQLKTFQQEESVRQAQFQRDLATAQTTGKWPDKGVTLAQQQLTADTSRLKEEQRQQGLRLGVQQTAATTAQTQATTEQSRWNATVKEAQQKMSGYMTTLRQNRTLEGQKFDALRAQQEAERTGLFDGPNGPQETLASRQMSIQENAQTMQREATMGLQDLQKTSMLQETERMQIQSDKDEAINTANIAAARKNHVDLINLEKLKLENQKEMTKWTFIQDYISDPVKHLVAARTGLIGVIEQMLDIDFGLPDLL